MVGLCGFFWMCVLVCILVFWGFFELNVKFPNVLAFHSLHCSPSLCSYLHKNYLVTLLSILIFLEINYAYAVGRLSICVFWLAAKHSMFKSFFVFIIFMICLGGIKLYIELSGKFSNINNNKKKSFTFYCSLEFRLQTISKLVWNWKPTILAMLPQFV